MTHDNIYMVNGTATAVATNANVPLGNIVRRYGCACNGTSNAVTLKECGYYQVDFNITYTGAAGAAAFAIQKNGTTINGAVASQTITTASTEINTATISAMIRVLRSELPSTITVLNNGVAVDASNAALRVTKE